MDVHVRTLYRGHLIVNRLTRAFKKLDTAHADRSNGRRHSGHLGGFGTRSIHAPPIDVHTIKRMSLAIDETRAYNINDLL
jgi:hypothetical protein